jgi:hypothetical protein
MDERAVGKNGGGEVDAQVGDRVGLAYGARARSAGCMDDRGVGDGT